MGRIPPLAPGRLAPLENGATGVAAAMTAPTPTTRADGPGAGPDRTGSERLGSELGEELRQAQHALLSRPRVSIRWRLVASLCLCLCLCGAFSLTALSMLGRVRAKLLLLDVAERLNDDVFLFRALGDGTASEDSVTRTLEDVAALEELLVDGGEIARVADQAALGSLVHHLAELRRLLERGRADPGPTDARAAPQAFSAAALAAAGTDVVRLLDRVGRRERASTLSILAVAEKGPVVLLGFLVVLFAAITYMFARALVKPIRRFQGHTARIAAGDFSLIRSAQKYRDEFTDLAVAVNVMLAELQAHQDRLVKTGKLAAVGTLTSGIAHELANPLNNIAITTETLLEELATLSDEEKWRLLQDVYFETERASEIVKSLLDFTRQEKVETVPLDLAEVVLSTARLAQNEMNLNNVALKIEIPPDLPRVLGAANQLRQVFLNLFLNAIQAVPGGGTLTVTGASEEAGRACVEIRDDGVGISPEVLPHVFDPFFTTKEPGLGTGLGLSVSLGIVRKFGGDIRVASEPGKGTVFHVCLPEAAE